MKKFFLFLMVSAMSTMSLTASGQEVDGIKLTLKDGSTVGIAYTSEPKFSFTSTDLVLTVTEGKVSYPMDGLKMTFGMVTPTGVEDISSADTQFIINGETIAARGIKAGETVTAYSLNGTLVGRAVADANGNASVNIPGRGVFVIKAGKISYKVTKF